MSLRKTAFSLAGRSAVIATVAALALSAVEPSSAYAGSRHKFGGGTAAAAAFAGVVGTGLAIAAAQNRAAYYDDGYGYYGAPVYAPAPVVVPYGYYGGYDPAYGPNHYGADVPYVNGHPLASW